MSWLVNPKSVSLYERGLAAAVSDEARFKEFRRDPGIQEIMEGLRGKTGLGYYAKLKDTDFFKQGWARIVKNDSVGSPRLITVPEGDIACTTLRYAWNVHEMSSLGVALDGTDVVEVGGGYGGLCRMVHEFHEPRSYTIVDLPGALALAQKYLERFGIHVNAQPCDAYDVKGIDTFVSNYALSELSKDVQRGYIDGLLSRASHGYVTHNSQPRDAENQLSIASYTEKLAGRDVITFNEDVPKSECTVIVWRPK